MRSISAIKSRYYAIARLLGAPAKHITFATQPRHDGGPHVERDGDAYYYVVSERGHELERRVTGDPEELLYWLVSDLASAMASEYELAHRRVGEDSRRQLFDKHVELLALANGSWSQRKRAEYDELLRSYPFSDSQA